MLSVIMLSVIMLSVIMLSVIMLSVIMLSVIMLSVMEPNWWLARPTFVCIDSLAINKGAWFACYSDLLVYLS